MNCNRFRFLIQQRFEFELAGQDDQMLMAHLDSCQSCARFEHQLDQVVQAAAELPLPEDAVPSNLESLARLIMQQLPQQKGSPLDIFSNLFGGGKAKEPKQKKEEAAPTHSGSRFPHVKRQQSQTEQAQSSTRVKKMNTSNLDEQQATSMRLKSLSKRPTASNDAPDQGQSGGFTSLGAKFGMAAPKQEPGQEEHELTLADTIRKKVTEDRQTKESQLQGDEGWGAPPGPQQDTPPVAINAPATPGQFGGGWAEPGSPDGGSWDEPGAAGQSGSWANDNNWSQPSQQNSAPAGGWEQPPQPQTQGGGWEQPPQPQPQSGGWEQPPQPQPQGGGWEQPPQPQPQGGGWEQPPQPQLQGGGWEQPPQPQLQGGGWEQPPQPQPKSGGWEQPPQPQPQSGGGWDSQAGQHAADAPPVPAPDNSWGPGPDNWTAAASGGQPVAQPDWNQPNAANNSWNEPPVPQAQNGGWSVEAEQVQTGTWEAFSPGNANLLGSQNTAPNPAAQQWNAPPPIPPPAPPAAEPAGERWDVPIQERMKQAQQAPAQEADSRWDTPIQGRSQPAAPAAGQADDRWDVPIQQRGQAAAPPAPAQAASGGLPADSIMDRLSNILGDGPAAAPPAPALQTPEPVASAPTADRWDVPIQERQKASAAEAAPTADRWDVPIQDRMRQDSAEAAPAPQVPVPAPAAAAQERWDVPIQERMKQGQAPPAAQQAGGLFSLDDNAMDKLFNQNLGVQEQAPAGARAAAGAPPPPPTPAPPVVSPFAAPPPPVPPAPTISPVAPRPPSEPAVPPAPPVPAASQPSGGGLFKNLDDGAMDKLFADNLGVADQQKSATPAPQPAPPPAPVPVAPSVPQPAAGGWNQAPPPAAPPALPGWGTPTAPAAAVPPPQVSPVVPPPAPPVAPQPKGGGLFSIDDDAMDRLFADNLGVKDASPPPPKVNVNEAVQSIRQVAEVAGQNMAAQQSMAPPQQPPPQPYQQQQMAPPPPPEAPQPVPNAAPPARVEGVGRLATHADTSSEAGSGKIASIGKFLLDQQDLSKIGNIAAADLSDSKMRILTLEAAQELQNLLSHIQQQPGVVGSVIVGHDGILIANSMPQDLEAESIGVWALGVYLNTDTTIKRMGHNHVHQAVCRTPRGYLIIADFGGGILVTLSDGAETERLIPLMRSITQLVSH